MQGLAAQVFKRHRTLPKRTVADEVRRIVDLGVQVVSEEAARAEYGVIIDKTNWSIDVPATDRTCATLRARSTVTT